MTSIPEALAAARAAARAGDLAGAEALYRQVLAAAPRNANALYQLGLLEFSQGDSASAEDFLRRAVQAAPESELCWANLGVILEQRGNMADAITSYRAALHINPQRAQLHTNLANALRAAERWPEAEASFRRALQLDPEHVDALHNLGALLKETGRYAEAAVYFRQAVAAAPQMVDAHVNLGAVLHALGHDDEALACYREAARLVPGYPDAGAGEITILERRGEIAEAGRILEPLLVAHPDHPDLAVAFATIAGKLSRPAEAAAMLGRVLGQPGLLRSKRQALLFARGQLLDSLHRYPEAFASYRDANALTLRGFDFADFTAYAARVRTVFTPDFMRRSPRAAHGSEVPIFVVGMPRSGTSLVEQILASHPAVFGAGELPEIDRLSLALPALLGVAAEFPECLSSVTAPALESAAGEYMDLLRRLAPDARRVVDKMPGNFMHLGFIELLFPQARVIHVERDPLDTCLSCYFQNFTAGHEYSYDLSLLGRVYREYERMMAHWRAVTNLRLLEARYENLVQNQEAETRRLLEFSGLAWDDRCLQFHETPRQVRTASYDQVRQPMYQRSAGRHRHYEEFLRPLREGLQAGA